MHAVQLADHVMSHHLRVLKLVGTGKFEQALVDVCAWYHQSLSDAPAYV
jgi:hypothetical protein